MITGHLPLTPTFFDGLFVAVNAAPDVQLILDCPACGCDKPGKTAISHDLMSTMIGSRGHRVHYSQLESDDLIFGSDQKLLRRVRETLDRGRPALLLLAQSSVTLLMGTDAAAAAHELQSKTGTPITVVRSNPLSGDYLDGFAAGLEAMAARAAPPPLNPLPGSMALIGLMMDRNEADCRANAVELRRMCEAAGAENPIVWPDGSPLRTLAAAASAQLVTSLPHGRAAAETIAARLGRETIALPVPIGLDGSARWLKTLAAALGREGAADDFIEEELGAAARALEWTVLNRFAARNAAVIADPYTAPELIAFLGELGIGVRAAALLTRNPSLDAGARRILQAPEHDETIIVDPSFTELESLWAGLHRAGRLDFIIGSGCARDAAKRINVPYLEIGYPSYIRHALFDAPYIGFRGALRLADSILNLLNEWEYGNYGEKK